ncbi:hypothetical protein CLV49_1068 [Labedella gwakjiensis]|uniref:LppP/LprE lipoprotein n=1 Tax=Labedella gwakjiensis TaxID=390269 RepID=A0A2P8GU20_9MICO|nr:hypothetical protein [Labedella gwakjiensis]PSL37461.1 hypothetical protein CLV49_1068 [Labedella gwakjiensis]RUQ84771.1 hypothetical protein ELQ93_14375 [Labedella gwakjiensis]
MTRPARITRFLLVAAVATLLSSCASEPGAPVTDTATPTASLSAEDAAALSRLAEVAGPTSNVDPDAITSTECWLPSEHLIDDETVNDTTWRVLCRAHYVDDSGDRYQDATCVGDFAAEPMIDHCYRWAFYTGMPHFEDFPGITADR